MGSQGAGRKRGSVKDYTFSAEDDALHRISMEADARLAAKRAARAEAREIRLRELERQKRADDAEKHHRRQRRQQLPPQLEPEDRGSTSAYGSGSRRSHNHESRSAYTTGGGRSSTHKRDPLPGSTLGARDHLAGDLGQKRSSRSGVSSSTAGLSVGGLGSRLRGAMRSLRLLLGAVLSAQLGCLAAQRVLVKRVQEGGTVVLNCTEEPNVNRWFWLPDFQECAEGQHVSQQFVHRIGFTRDPDCELTLHNVTARDAGKLITSSGIHPGVELVITPDCDGLHIKASPRGPFMVGTSVNLSCQFPQHVSPARPVNWTFFTLGKGTAEEYGEVVTASKEGLWTCIVGDRTTHFCLAKSSSTTMDGWWCNETNQMTSSEVARSTEDSPWTHLLSLPTPGFIAICVGAVLLPLLLITAISYECYMRKRILLSPYATQYDCKPQNMLPEKVMTVPNHVEDHYQESGEDCGEEYVPMSGLSQGSGTELEIELQDYENISKSETVSGNADAQPRKNEDVYFNDDLYGEVE